MSPAAALVLAGLAHRGPDPGVTVPDVGPATARGPEGDPSGEPLGDPTEDPAVRAATLFREGDFVAAAAAFLRAYEQTGDAALLFGRAQALRRAGNCGGAIEVFEEFIATDPPAADVEAARGVIAQCREILGEDRREPPPPVPIETPSDTPPQQRPARWHRDVAGGVLLGSGLVVATIGGALLGTAYGRDGAREESESDYEARDRSVRALGASGVALLVGGGALLVGSAVRYAIVAKRLRRRGEVATLSWGRF